MLSWVEKTLNLFRINLDLPNRENIIVTRQKTYLAKDSLVVNSIEEAPKIAKNKNEKEAFIIGEEKYIV